MESQNLTKKGSLPAMFWFIWLEGYLAICAILLHKICKYASTGFTAAQLYPCTIEATKVLM